jgi:ComF family protein
VIRRAVHQLKYQRAQHLAEPLVDALLDARGDIPPVDIVVPVPLHPARLKARGYNQAALLAVVLARRIERPIAEAGLIRVKDTHTQVTIPAAQRWGNVSDAFQLGVDGPSLVGKHILLVDDVATTTSTLRAAARVLRQSGVSRVDGLVAARATTTPPSIGTKVAPSGE